MKKSLFILPLLLVLGFIGTKAQQPIQMVSGVGGYPILAPDGTNAAPTYTFSNNSNSGIYNSAGLLGFTIAGTARLTVNSSGLQTTKLNDINTPCISTAAPAVCGTNAFGTSVVAAAATTVVVNTTAVTASSLIFLTFDSSQSTNLSVTCNATEPALYGVTARTAATSFTITSSAPTTNPACFNWFVMN